MKSTCTAAYPCPRVALSPHVSGSTRLTDQKHQTRVMRPLSWGTNNHSLNVRCATPLVAKPGQVDPQKTTSTNQEIGMSTKTYFTTPHTVCRGKMSVYTGQRLKCSWFITVAIALYCLLLVGIHSGDNIVYPVHVHLEIGTAAMWQTHVAPSAAIATPWAVRGLFCS